MSSLLVSGSLESTYRSREVLRIARERYRLARESRKPPSVLPCLCARLLLERWVADAVCVSYRWSPLEPTRASRFRRQRFPPIDDVKSDGTDRGPSIEFGPAGDVSTGVKFRSVARLRNDAASL